MSLTRSPDARAAMTACPACGSTTLEAFYEVASVPVHSCLMMDTRSDAEAFSRDDLRLAICADCGFITNVLFDPKWSAYAPNYEDQQSFSPTFSSFAGNLARDLVDRYDLRDRDLVEIGCSKGDFIAMLCELGHNRGVGIDPSALEGRVKTEAADRLRFLNAYYGLEYVDIPADFICCRHTLEHIQPVRAFADLLRAAVEHNRHAPVMIEIPETARVLTEAAFEDIYYEHCSYFTPGTLASLMRRAGFEVYDLRVEYDDQYLVIETGTDPGRGRRFDIEESVAETRAMVDTFKNRIGPVQEAWRDRIREVRGRGGKVAIWGSGSKCVAFLSTLGMEGEVDCVVDINPNRHGKYIPGLAIRIDAPARIVELAPDLVIVMNRIYMDEISQAVSGMGVRTELHAL